MVDNKQLPPYIVPIIQNEQPPKRKRLGILREAVIIIVLAILIGGSYTLFHHSSDNASVSVISRTWLILWRPILTIISAHSQVKQV
jgi:TRAP-type C4-dicarboxylate transport system permease small subunit